MTDPITRHAATVAKRLDAAKQRPPTPAILPPRKRNPTPISLTPTDRTIPFHNPYAEGEPQRLILNDASRTVQRLKQRRREEQRRKAVGE